MNRPMMRLTTALTFPFLLCTWILAGMSSMSAVAHPLGIDFSTATDLGATTSWTNGRTNTAGRLTGENGVNFFRFRVSSRGPVQMWTTGAFQRSGFLYDSDEVDLTGRESLTNFRLARTLYPGVYYLRVTYTRGFRKTPGPYRLHLDTETGDDDHSDSFEGATRISLPSKTTGRLHYMNRNPLCCPRDQDVFWFHVAVAGTVRIWTTGNLWVSGFLYDSDEVYLDGHESLGNFRLARTLDPGVYYLRVTHTSGFNPTLGPYSLHVDSDTGAGIIPMFPSASRSNLQGFARVVNHSDEEASVRITAVDDAGVRHSPVQELSLSPWQVVHFNSRDLERGNASKGIVGVGSGTGDWYLEVTPESPGIRTLGYIRTTSDGFLASMNTVAPHNDRVHWIATFNPAGNPNQVSVLRVIHPRCPQSECESANVSIVGVDDVGRRSGRVTLALRPGQARMVTAQQLEQGDDAFQGEGAGIGDGTGKWRLLVTADQPVPGHVAVAHPDGASGQSVPVRRTARLRASLVSPPVRPTGGCVPNREAAGGTGNPGAPAPG